MPPPLYFLPRRADEPGSPRVPDPRWGALIGLLVTLLLVLGGLILVRVLTRAARVQDCVISGRTNCAPIVSAASGGR
ncbi:MAG: hypothetical protein ACREUG_15070 [Steroidobacteraceae bacterium]